MGRKSLYIGAVLLLAFASASAVSRKERLQVIYREQENGEWQVFVFGLPNCNNVKNMQVIYPKDATQPVEIECDLPAK